MKIVNSFLKKRISRRWTWISPNCEAKNLVDYIIVPTKYNNIVNFDVLRNLQFHSDHRPIACYIEQRKGKRKVNRICRKKNIEEDATYERIVSEILKDIKEMNNENSPKTGVQEMEQKYRQIATVIGKATQRYIMETSKESKSKKGGRPEGISELYKKRNHLLCKNKRSNEEKIELNLISKLIRKRVRAVSYTHLTLPTIYSV